MTSWRRPGAGRRRSARPPSRAAPRAAGSASTAATPPARRAAGAPSTVRTRTRRVANVGECMGLGCRGLPRGRGMKSRSVHAGLRHRECATRAPRAVTRGSPSRPCRRGRCRSGGCPATSAASRGSMPSWWYTVAARSSTPSGSLFGSAPVASLTSRRSCPVLIPPPARTTLNTFGQWSRPASLLIFGVRPNSLTDHDQRRVEQPALLEVADQRRERLVERRHLPLEARCRCSRGGPSRRTSSTRTARPPRPAAGPCSIRCPAVFLPYSSLIASGSAFRLNASRRSLRADHRVRPLIERVHRVERRPIFSIVRKWSSTVASMLLRRSNRSSSIAARQAQVAHLEVPARLPGSPPRLNGPYADDR